MFGSTRRNRVPGAESWRHIGQTHGPGHLAPPIAVGRSALWPPKAHNMAVYAQVTQQKGARLLCAGRAVDGELVERRTWRLGAPDSAVRAAVSELRELVGSDELMTFRAAELHAASGAGPTPAGPSLYARAVDLQQLAFLAYPTAPSYSLADLCKHAGIEAGKPNAGELGNLVHLHRALARCLAALDASLLHDLHRRLATARWPGGAVLERAIAGRQTARVGPAVYAALVPRRERKRSRTRPREACMLEPAAIARDLSPGGLISSAHPAYEHRPGQIEMAQAASTAFNQDELLAVEAGSGTGKSLAYLLPGIKWAVANGERVVVSTNTKSLQDQLATKDVPLLQSALQEPFAATVAKGRGNYACLRKVMARAADAEGSLFFEEQFPVAYLLRWLTESPTGDLSAIPRDALSSIDGLRALADDVRSQGESCVGYECVWRPNCPVERMRRRAENADLIIANHALVFADTAVQTLPEYQCLILDEAHNLEHVATDQFGLEVSRQGVLRLLRLLRGRLRSPAGGSAAGGASLRRPAGAGLLGTVLRRIEQVRGEAGVERLPALIESCRSLADAVQEELAALTERVVALAPRGTSRRGDRLRRWTLRLAEPVRQSPTWQAVREQANRLLSAGKELCGYLADMSESIGELASGAVIDQEGLQRDVQAHGCQWEEALGALAAILAGTDAEDVCWVEAGEASTGAFWAMKRAPIYVGEHLKNAVFDPKRALILTSATLTVDTQFHYLRQRLGLESQEHRLAELTVASPFDHRRQLLLCIPTDMPLPNEHNYLESVCSAVTDIAERAGGGTLVLFTAHSTMAAAYERLLPRMRQLKLDLLCQEVSGARTELLEELRRDRRTVLLGVKSFWEGVDVPGAALRCLIVVKLPFAAPSDPVIEARCEHLESQDIDSRSTYYVPQAILGFRQGLGRLVRTRRDRGVAFVLDRRLLVRAYGRRFLNSIERCSVACEPLATCLERAGSWLRRR